jgi:hypothetical protein
MNKTVVPKHTLSKSTFMRGCQCTKSLWLHKHMPHLKDEMSEAQANIFSSGTNVGELARDLFPGGVDASPATAYEYQQSVADTAAYIAAGHKIIYEAAFQFDGILAAIDILVQHRGRWHAYEVKSSTKVKEQFVQDAALQYYVITQSGLNLHDISLVHINNSYVRRGDLDLQNLFSRTSLKKEVAELQSFIHDKAKELKKILALKNMPAMDAGKQCTKPYTCDFYGHCWKDVAQEIGDEIENIDKAALKSFIKGLQYPLYFMDFETVMVAVPEWDGHWPYRQVPFQFSVHVQQKPGAKLQHIAYLANVDCDPCPHFVEQLIKAVGKEGSVLVYNQTFEEGRLKELKKDYPKYKKSIENIQSRLVDLMVPFRKKHFYLPSMNGSYSLKAVLPALVPALSYNGLSITNGADASTAFYNLKFEQDEQKIQQTREALLKYCELDTLAMVRVLEKMKTQI